MSICSDVYITREKAEMMVKNKLEYQQRLLIKQAIKGMDDYELTNHLNEDGSLYYFHIESNGEENE
jgi:hypothetical protein